MLYCTDWILQHKNDSLCCNSYQNPSYAVAHPERVINLMQPERLGLKALQRKLQFDIRRLHLPDFVRIISRTSPVE